MLCTYFQMILLFSTWDLWKLDEDYCCLHLSVLILIFLFLIMMEVCRCDCLCLSVYHHLYHIISYHITYPYLMIQWWLLSLDRSHIRTQWLKEGMVWWMVSIISFVSTLYDMLRTHTCINYLYVYVWTLFLLHTYL